jgi:hypothetical protein
MKALIVETLLLLAISVQASAQGSLPNAGGIKNTNTDNCGLLYGKNHSLTFCAPDGWVLDNGILNDQGIYAAFYPNGSTWQHAKDSGTIMYINVVGRAADSTVEKMMADDAEEARQSAPTTVVKQGESIKIGDLSAPTLRFAPGDFDRHEAVAYIGEEKVLVMFVISSKNEKIFKKDYSAFVQLVQSYKFLSSNVTVEHK